MYRLFSKKSTAPTAAPPDTPFATPSGKVHVLRMPSSELVRQIAPRATGPANPEKYFDKPAIVGHRLLWIAFLDKAF